MLSSWFGKSENTQAYRVIQKFNYSRGQYSWWLTGSPLEVGSQEHEGN
jgi:hypothetical protein